MGRIFSCLLFLLFASAVSAGPDGKVRVIDGDTLDIGGIRVRLHGIDAPEIGQPCLVNGNEWDCGTWVRDIVRTEFEGREARCDQVETDRYGRVVATCNVDGRDMGQVIVGDGLAWAYRRYSSAYDLDEKAAAISERGLWAFEVQNPADYRTARVSGREAPDANCAIKGNISANGRIYHLPGGRGYARTGINIANGERWFCSETEARNAGWRRARN